MLNQNNNNIIMVIGILVLCIVALISIYYLYNREDMDQAPKSYVTSKANNRNNIDEKSEDLKQEVEEVYKKLRQAIADKDLDIFLSLMAQAQETAPKKGTTDYENYRQEFESQKADLLELTPDLAKFDFLSVEKKGEQISYTVKPKPELNDTNKYVLLFLVRDGKVLYDRIHVEINNK